MRIRKSELLNKNILPENSGLMIFKSEKKIIFSLCVLDLKQKFIAFKKRIKENHDIFSLFSKTLFVEWYETDTLFDALLKEKQILFDKEEPEYNRYFYNKFVYLGIDFENVPYFTINDDTTSQKIFLGPFHGRFFVWDFILAMNELFLYPACETKEYPCELYEKNRCIGSCLQKGIKDIAINDYLTVNDEKISLVRNQYNKLSDNLEFEKAETIKHSIKILEKYYYYLKFFYVTKNLNLTLNDTIVIKNGLIKKISDYEFPEYDMEYEKKEFLSTEKRQLNERWIIFDYLIKKDKKMIDDIYKKQRELFIKMRAYE